MGKAGNTIMTQEINLNKRTLAPDSSRFDNNFAGSMPSATDKQQPQNKNLFGEEDEFKFEGLEIQDMPNDDDDFDF